MPLLHHRTHCAAPATPASRPHTRLARGVRVIWDVSQNESAARDPSWTRVVARSVKATCYQRLCSLGVFLLLSGTLWHRFCYICYGT